jgi:hypothetical protein
MSKFLFLVSLSSFVILSINALPVKESSTEKDPNAHKKDEESPTHNLENIIGG